MSSKAGAGWFSGPQGAVAAGLAALGMQRAMSYGRRSRSSKGKRMRTYKKYKNKFAPGKGKKRRMLKRPRLRAPVSTQLRQLKRRVEAGMGTYIEKHRETQQLTAANNGINLGSYPVNTLTIIEGVIDALPVFNPALPGTYTSVDFTSGTQQKEVEIASTKSWIKLRNNSNQDIYVRVYLVQPKEDTSYNPRDTVTNGLTDMGSGLTVNTPLLTPLDSQQFCDLYSITKSVKRKLLPGSELMMNHYVRSFQYDPSFADSHNLQFQARWGTHVYLVRLEGPIAHDATTTTNIGRMQAAVDIELGYVHTIKYEAGADIKYIVVDDDNESMASANAALENTPVIAAHDT